MYRYKLFFVSKYYDTKKLTRLTVTQSVRIYPYTVLPQLTHALSRTYCMDYYKAH